MSEALRDSLRGYVYKPRTVAFQGVRTVGRWQVKCTVITVRGRAAHFTDVIDGAWEAAGRLLAAVPEDGRDAGVAHLTIHLSLGGVRLLLDWWSEGDMLRHRGLHAPLDDPSRFTEVAARHDGPFVWELAVQAHERDAWVRHVLARPDGPDLPAYLADGLTASL